MANHEGLRRADPGKLDETGTERVEGTFRFEFTGPILIKRNIEALNEICDSIAQDGYSVIKLKR
jgi:hypothetical protein